MTMPYHGGGAASSPSQFPSGSGAANYGGVFGDGSSGAVVLDGVNTFSFMSLAGSTYSITQQVLATSLTVNNGITLKMNGWYIMCTGTVTVNPGGVISEDGNNASGASGGGGTNFNALVLGSAGGNGTTTNGQNGAGSAGDPLGSIVGGNGGAGSGGSGGTGQTGVYFTNYLRNPWALRNGFMHATSTLHLAPGLGGGGGGGDTTNSGGGGGGGAGNIAIYAPTMINNGSIHANGGNGANGIAGNSGGGGGGSGGIITIYTTTVWTQGTMTATGGTHGNGVGTGANGTNGSAGILLNVIIS